MSVRKCEQLVGYCPYLFEPTSEPPGVLERNPESRGGRRRPGGGSVP